MFVVIKSPRHWQASHSVSSDCTVKVHWKKRLTLFKVSHPPNLSPDGSFQAVLVDKVVTSSTELRQCHTFSLPSIDQNTQKVKIQMLFFFLWKQSPHFQQSCLWGVTTRQTVTLHENNETHVWLKWSFIAGKCPPQCASWQGIVLSCLNKSSYSSLSVCFHLFQKAGSHLCFIQLSPQHRHWDKGTQKVFISYPACSSTTGTQVYRKLKG